MPLIHFMLKSQTMALNVVENVVKQGYLKKGTSGSSRISGFFKRNETNKWFVFTIRQGIPFLEYYDTDVDVFTQQPINSFNLSGCQNVKSMGNTNPPSFCIVCPDRVIELIASSRTQMVEWVNEVEASLIRLGVLQQEVVDHVYTMCPAVIQKPRISKDLNNDNDEEDHMSSQTAVKIIEDRKSSQAALKKSEDKKSSQTSIKKTDEQRTSGISNSTNSNLLSPVELRSDRPSLSPKASPQAQRSNTHQASAESPSSPAPNKSSSRQESPPPLPSRQPPQPVRASNKGKVDDHYVKKTYRSEQLDSNSSNDSDFVSPEIIAQLRESRQVKNAEIAKLSLSEENVEPSGNHNPSLHSQIKDADGGQNHKPKLAKLHISKKGNDSVVTTTIGDDTSSTSSHFKACSDVAGLCAVPGDRNSAENQYSDLPCHWEGSNRDGAAERPGLAHDNDDPLDSSAPFSASKPIPMPRRLSKKSSDSSSPESLTNGIHLSSSIKDKSGDSEEILNCILAEMVMGSGETLLEDIDDEYPMLIQNGRDYFDMRGKPFLSDSANKSIMTQTPQNIQALKSRKDENENFYGYDASPPDTMAPPIPPLSPIPPLPPRNDSLPRKKSDPSALKSSSDPKLLSSEVKSSSAHAKVLEELIGAPPLPLPRRKAPFVESFRKSHPPSAFVSSGSHEIPPMPPRRPSHTLDQNSSIDENQPPALPSRNSQSFFIKRPHASSVELPVGDTRSEDLFRLNKTQEPGLARKMLLDRSHSLHTVVSLKQTQADILQAEIMMPSVVVQLTQKSCHGLALVGWRDSVCIVGWNQKDFPSLHGKLHVGDILLSVNNVMVTSVDMAQRLLKQPNTSKVDIALHRMPYAKVFAIRKNVEGQSLGIKREGGTGEIVYVDPNGLAAQHGLTQYAQSPSGPTRCTWFLTEINNRPLNIFFKDTEIDHRLAAVGREISIVVQPSEFILDLRHQFKKIKNYKSFITQ